MIICSLDFETTGLSPENDRVIEVGTVLYSTGQNKMLESSGYLVKTDVPISPTVTSLTSITQAAVNKFGFDSRTALETLVETVSMADAIAGQNISRFDMRFAASWAQREGIEFPQKLIIDTRTDLPDTEGKHLGYMAADAGFLNLFPHSALTDCMTVVKLISMKNIDQVIERAKSPTIVLMSQQNRNENHKAKQRKFKWNSEPYKIWWKTVKEMDFASEIKACEDIGLPVVLAPKDVLVERLWYD